ncbi:MAG: SDR family oxidoreductase [Candidatus Scalindua sp.]|nr:SDR family oxidoreductase [Candidatus Scalindua sp.]
MNTEYLDNLFSVSDKVVLVTGATGQIGYEICKAYKEAGAFVYGVDKILDDQKMVKSDRVEYIELDVTDKESVLKNMDYIISKHVRLDILINNAGVSCFEPFEDRPEESFDWVMDVNLKGTFFCIQAYAKYAVERKLKGSIVNIASMYGIISPDFRIYNDGDRKNSEIYGATKAGVIQMTRYFAVHLAKHEIRVNSVSPGGIYNPESPQGADFISEYSFRCPMGRMANVNEVIGAILYLSSNAASYTTGHNMVIDGGMSCW